MNPAKFAADRLVGPYAAAQTWFRAVDHYAADWDAMVILDACRSDAFRVACPAAWRSRTGARYSAGASTAEWLRATFASRDAHDTVYVTANPMHLVEDSVGTDLAGTFHAVADVWETAWDDELGTVAPDAVTVAARRAAREHPDKRLLVHYLQPHTPFVGPYARERGIGVDTTADHARDRARDREGHQPANVWEDLEDGSVSPSEVWIAYSENTRIAVNACIGLVEDLRKDRRVVVSSDHGNAFGERSWPFLRRYYGHPTGRWTPAIRRVPWVELEARGKRVDVAAEPPTESSAPAPPTVLETRLEALGYV